MTKELGSSDDETTHHLSPGAKAGIAIGAVASVVILAACGYYLLYWHKWKRLRALVLAVAAAAVAGIEATESSDPGQEAKQELDDGTSSMEDGAVIPETRSRDLDGDERGLRNQSLGIREGSSYYERPGRPSAVLVELSENGHGVVELSC